jgi:hypothetical protein
MRPTLYFASRKLRARNLKRTIFARLQQLSDARDGDTERQTIEDAINLLKILKPDGLNFPDWESGSVGSKQILGRLVFGFRNKQGLLHRSSGESVRFVSKA